MPCQQMMQDAKLHKTRDSFSRAPEWWGSEQGRQRLHPVGSAVNAHTYAVAGVDVGINPCLGTAKYS